MSRDKPTKKQADEFRTDNPYRKATWKGNATSAFKEWYDMKYGRITYKLPKGVKVPTHATSKFKLPSVKTKKLGDKEIIYTTLRGNKPRKVTYEVKKRSVFGKKAVKTWVIIKNEAVPATKKINN